MSALRHAPERSPPNRSERRNPGSDGRINFRERPPDEGLVGQTIAVANQKGGVGKTTTVVNLGSYLALAGEQVLVLDLDPQGNATSALGCDRSILDRSVYDAVVGEIELERLMVETVVPGLCLIPSSMALAGAEVELGPIEQRERRLSTLLTPIKGSFDYILVDCPPSLGLLTVNALTAADSVLVPLQSEYFALEGLGQLLATVDLVRDHLNPRLEIKGVVLTMADGRTKLSADVEREARKHLGDLVYTTTIPRNIRLSEAPSHGVPIHRYRPASPGAVAYKALAAEIRTRDAVTAQPRPLVPVMAEPTSTETLSQPSELLEPDANPVLRTPVGAAQP
jgi:chromosome partitioning protein